MVHSTKVNSPAILGMAVAIINTLVGINILAIGRTINSMAWVLTFIPMVKGLMVIMSMVSEKAKANFLHSTAASITGTLSEIKGNYFSNPIKSSFHFINLNRNGYGTYTYFGTAESYEGYWQDNYKHGKGSFYYAYGDVYEGEFEDNDRSGHGKLQYNDGGYYDGEWYKDLAHGYGTLKTNDHKTYKGDF
jgi:hypothetical protein